MKQTGETDADVAVPRAEPSQPFRPILGQTRQIGYIGKQLGRFLIQSELGRGGMATVYRAHDPQLGRDVAVKVMHGFFAGRADLEARFRREANAVAGIRHPSILALYDFAPPRGEEPAYLVSELIEGCDLRQLVAARGGRLLPEVAVLIAARVADALGAAHAAGVVHRDVKPDNVLVDGAGGGGGVARVVLTDFGIAHVAGMETMTATGAVLGSPAYMSPEQARGDEVGPPSDVFSLGVLLYQLCTGHLPFGGKDPLTTLSAILRGEFVRPSRLEAHVGPELEEVMLRCLAREPGARYPTGAAAAKALRAWLEVEASFGDEAAALRHFLDAPEQFESEVAARVSAAAVSAAEAARRRGQLTRALGEVGRALAYAPDDPRARELLAALGRGGGAEKRRVIACVVGVAIVAGAAGAGAWIYRAGHRRGGGEGAPLLVVNPTRMPGAGAGSTTTLAAPASAATPSTSRAPRPTAGVIARANPAPALPGGAPGPRVVTHRRSPSARARRPSGLEETTAPVISEQPARDDSAAANEAHGEEQAGGDRATVSGSLQREPAVARAGMVLRASQGFCEPSLDEHPPSLRASYTDLAPGAHDVFCTLPQGGPKVLVARYELKPGARPSLSIVPGNDGRPILARPE